MSLETRVLKLHHANLRMTDDKSKPVELFLNQDLVFYWYFSETHKSTVVHSNGAALVPVIETVEQINNQLKGGNQ